MNHIEKLREHLREECEPCILNAIIIEFEQLPESGKYNFDYYDKEKDFILYCQKCEVFKLIPSD